VIARLALDHVGQPEDGAAAVLFLCSEQANDITGIVLRWTADSSSTTRVGLIESPRPAARRETRLPASAGPRHRSRAADRPRRAVLAEDQAADRVPDRPVAVGAPARKLASHFWCLLTRERDYAPAQTS
jgi:hypothetical protein